MAKIAGAITFSVETSKNTQNDILGERITEWVKTNPFITMEEKIVVQSDNYISVLIFYSGQMGGKSPI